MRHDDIEQCRIIMTDQLHHGPKAAESIKKFATAASKLYPCTITTTLGLLEGSRQQTTPFAQPLQQRRLRQFNRAAKVNTQQARHAAFLHRYAIKPMHPPHGQRVVRHDQEACAAFGSHGIQQIT